MICVMDDTFGTKNGINGRLSLLRFRYRLRQPCCYRAFC
jgi:hypothetical protein